MAIQSNLRRDLIVRDDPKAVGSEAFRTLRTNLQFTSPDRELKTIMITSAGPGEGKSTIVSNLAVAYAQSSKRVIIVGCDLRKPVIHKVFGIPNHPGLTSFLVGRSSLDEIVLDSGIQNLRLIPSGPVPPNPAELLQSQTMRDMISTLREQADIILFDAAPIIAVTDAAVLASSMDGTVLTLASGKVTREMAVQAKELLEQAGANILGVVLNRVRLDASRKHHYYYYYSQEKEA